MGFGARIRELRKGKALSQRGLADKVRVSYTYISRIENENLDFSDYPSEALIRRLASALDADADELLVLAKKIPDDLRERFLERPDAFRKFASLDDALMDELLAEAERRKRTPNSKRRATVY